MDKIVAFTVFLAEIKAEEISDINEMKGRIMRRTQQLIVKQEDPHASRASAEGGSLAGRNMGVVA